MASPPKMQAKKKIQAQKDESKRKVKKKNYFLMTNTSLALLVAELLRESIFQIKPIIPLQI